MSYIHNCMYPDKSVDAVYLFCIKHDIPKVSL
jgi:hypothetical protein